MQHGHRQRGRRPVSAGRAAAAALLLLALLPACRSPEAYRREADARAAAAIDAAQQTALGRTEPFTIAPATNTLRARLVRAARPAPAPTQAPAALPPLTLLDALQVAARNSRTYQGRKETLYRTALALDLERHEFRTRFGARLSSLFSSDRGTDTDGTVQSAAAETTRRFAAGPDATLELGLDFARLLSGEEASSLGVLADASISIPLLRGRGRAIVREPLTQAERDVVYAVYAFEEFKRSFAVDIASEYLAVLRARDQVRNAEENLERLRAATARARALADAGRVPEIEVDQSRQDELSAGTRVIAARQSFARAGDAFKVALGLPPDAPVALDPAELDRLSQSVPPAASAGDGASVTPSDAVAAALARRPDMIVSRARVADAERAARVAADALRAELTLLGSASAGESRSIGSAGEEDADLSLAEGRYSGLLTLDLPLDRTAERNAYRTALIALEQSRRDRDEQSDTITLAVRNGLRSLQEAAETVAIQRRAVALAEQREKSTNLFLQAGRARMRDLLEAREALLDARNALTAALVDWRVSLLALQRDMGILQVDHTGLWTETPLDEAVRPAGQKGEQPDPHDG
ncbi:MAG: TolC family protein [Lentisphaerae bacterium]|nr:TolC family protein [Lentisphaerota bacterium]